mmetsp:Transcript_110255/g.195198  ORF Transcript_110255/g.195198 Transcript_110255/m.195198 type:complete len:286 (+) Transcript_110255:68-925(+)
MLSALASRIPACSSCTGLLFLKSHRQASAAAKADSVARLCLLASEIRESRNLAPISVQDLWKKENYEMQSAYLKPNGTSRGFCNWLVRNSMIIGRYPCCDPTGRPTLIEARSHMRFLVENDVTTYVCLQAELPPQTGVWPADGVKLEGMGFTNNFVNYASIAAEEAMSLERPTPIFLHFPIKDMNVPSWELLVQILDSLLVRLRDDGCLYIHCWGGMGRAGLVGACMLSLLQPELGPEEILICTQAAYDSRSGSSGARSPQTWMQRALVRDFSLHVLEVASESGN